MGTRVKCERYEGEGKYVVRVEKEYDIRLVDYGDIHNADYVVFAVAHDVFGRMNTEAVEYLLEIALIFSLI